MATRTWAIVVAGGEGRRFGAAKQFLPLAGHTVLEWSVAAARSVAEAVVAVLPADALADPSRHGGADHVTAGGTTRSDSVRAGLALVPEEVEYVLVHDAARPGASAALFAAVLGALETGLDAAIPAIAVRDTIKRVQGDLVVETLDRTELVAVQTPQGFRAAVLRAAHAAGGEATDDAAMVEAAGGKVAVVPGEEENVKLTEAGDLAALTATLARRAGALH